MHKIGTTWNWPKPEKKIFTVRETIGNLPSLEAGQKSDIKWHFARKHTPENILWMKHTPTGCSAFSNPVYFPKKADGTRIKGFMLIDEKTFVDRPSNCDFSPYLIKKIKY